MIDLGSAVARLKLNTGEFDSSLSTAAGRLKSIGKTMAVGFVTATAAVGAGMVSFGKSAVEAGKVFDKSMSQVAATMGVTIDEIQDLRDFAMEMGAKTAFSATEAADALNYMALAGYDAETSMSMLPNVLNLAAAGSFELSRASDMITDSQSALGLSIEETSELVDKMARASSKSNTSVEQLGEAILTVGGTAKMLSGGTTELATALGILADNGIKGAEGGTALRNILLSLATPTKEAQDALIEFGGAEKLVYDAAGNMRSLNDIFMDLNEITKDMTQQERTELFGKLFNKRDLKSAEALVANVGDRFEELSAAIDDSRGAAEKMAETQLDNLAGDVTLFQSALEGAKITLSDSLTPVLREFVQFGTEEIGKLDSAFKQGGIEGFADQLGRSLGDATSMLLKKAPTIITALGKLTSSLLTSLGSTLKKSFPKILKFALNTLKDLAKSLAKAIPDIMSGIGEMIGEVITNIPDILGLGVDIAKNLVIGIGQGFDSFFSGLFSGLGSAYSKELQAMLGETQEKIDELRVAYDKVNQSRKEQTSNIETEYGYIRDLKDEYNKLVGSNGEIISGYEDRANFIKNQLAEALGIELQDIEDLIEANGRFGESIDKVIIKKQAEATLLASEEAYKDAIKNRTQALNTLSEAQNNVNTLEARAAEQKAAWVEADQEYNRLLAEGDMQAAKVAGVRASSLKTAFEETNKALAQAKFQVRDAEAVWISYNSTIQNYEGLSSAVISGDVEKISVALLNMQNDFITAEVGNRRTLEKQLENYEANLASIEKAIENGTPGVTQEMADQARALVNAARVELQKLPEEAEDSTFKMTERIVDSLVEGAPGVVNATRDLLSGLDFKDFAKNIGSSLGDFYVNAIADAIEKGKGAVQSAVSQISSVMSGVQIPNRVSGAYASGLDYVPRTMAVTVHRGERILTQEENKRYSDSSDQRIEVTTVQDPAALNKLNDTMNAVLKELKGFQDMKMVVDGKKLVGSIVKEVDKQLAFAN